MKIIDLTPENEHLFFCCLEDWSDEMKEAGDHKKKWYEFIKDKGLRVKLAVDDNNVPGGMIQYLPVEHAMMEGKDLHAVLCIWVHGYKEGRGDFRKKGMGSALLKAAEEDVRNLGSGGLVTWGLAIPVFMKASWFRRKGYQVVDKMGMMRLMWKPFREDGTPPSFIRPKKLPVKGGNKVNITVFRNGWCPAMNLAYERALRASKDFEEKVDFHVYPTSDLEVKKEWGIMDGLFIDGKEVRTGPPPSYLKVRKKIERRVKRLSRAV